MVIKFYCYSVVGSLVFAVFASLQVLLSPRVKRSEDRRNVYVRMLGVKVTPSGIISENDFDLC